MVLAERFFDFNVPVCDRFTILWVLVTIGDREGVACSAKSITRFKSGITIVLGDATMGVLMCGTAKVGVDRGDEQGSVLTIA